MFHICTSVGFVSGANDQTVAASFWSSPEIQETDFFHSSHEIVQTHPDIAGLPKKNSFQTNKPSSGHKYDKHLDFRTSATAELRKNPLLSSPEECARACREGEPPKICYYHFTLEYYTVLGA